jgi:hypothetical protein
MSRRGKLIAIDDVPIKKSEETPQTVGELSADRSTQRADREAIDRKHYLERRRGVLYSLFFSHELARDRERQLDVSRELDEIEAELNALRPVLGSTGPRATASGEQVAKSDSPIGIGARKQRDTLGTLLRTPTVRKTDHLPDPFELDNSLGIRSQARIKE